MVVTYEKYEVHVSSDCMTLYKKSEKENSKGERNLINLGYFQDMEGAIKKIVKCEMGDTDIRLTLKEYIQAYKETVSIIKEALAV